MKTLSATALFLAGQSEAKWSKGTCPEVPTVQNLDASRYVGKWYEMARDQQIPFELGASCTTAHYTVRDDGDLDVANRSWYWYAFGQYISVHGKARCDTAHGECTVGFFGQPVTGEANYRVLNTDYDNYSVVYNCSPFGMGKFEVMWLLSRNNTLDTATE